MYSIRCRKFLRMNSREYNRKGEAMATGTKIIKGLFGWWEDNNVNISQTVHFQFFFKKNTNISVKLSKLQLPNNNGHRL